MRRQEIHLELLLGNQVYALNGRAIGRVEEVCAELDQGAASVNEFLVQHGIEQARLIPKGYGPDRPLATNDTELGRQQNRRIEFRILH